MDQPTRPIGSIIFQKVCFGVLTFALLARKLESFQDLNFRSGIQTENTFHKDGSGLLISMLFVKCSMLYFTLQSNFFYLVNTSAVRTYTYQQEKFLI